MHCSLNIAGKNAADINGEVITFFFGTVQSLFTFFGGGKSSEHWKRLFSKHTERSL